MSLIRRALPNEADALSQIALSAKAHWGYPERWMEIWKPQLIFEPDYFTENESWVIEAEGIPIGFYTLQVRDEIAWLENLWVLPDYIGKGVGRRMFLHAVDLASQRGYKVLQLEVEPNAIGFYEKMGMIKIGEHQYELDGEPRILPLMEMIL